MANVPPRNLLAVLISRKWDYVLDCCEMRNDVCGTARSSSKWSAEHQNVIAHP